MQACFCHLAQTCIFTGMQCSMALPMAPQIYWYGILWICLGSEQTTQLNNIFIFKHPTCESNINWKLSQDGGSLAQQAFDNDVNNNYHNNYNHNHFTRWWQFGPTGTWPRQDGTDSLGSSFWVKHLRHHHHHHHHLYYNHHHHHI